MDSPASTIFISYAREDSALALQIASALKAEGLPLWLDQLDIRPGERWDTAVEQALQRSGTLLVLLSSAAVASQNVMDEVSYGLDEGKRVLPLRLGEAALPLRLRRLQYVELASTEPQAVAAALQRLQGVLAQGAPGVAAAPAEPLSPPPSADATHLSPGTGGPRSPHSPHSTRSLRLTGIAVAVMGLLSMALYRLLVPTPEPDPDKPVPQAARLAEPSHQAPVAAAASRAVRGTLHINYRGSIQREQIVPLNQRLQGLGFRIVRPVHDAKADRNVVKAADLAVARELLPVVQAHFAALNCTLEAPTTAEADAALRDGDVQVVVSGSCPL